MSAQINNYSFSNIGRMFARQNVPAIYGQQKAVSQAEPDGENQQVDRVNLSPNAPKPFTAAFLEGAMEVGNLLGSGGEPSSGQSQRLREDRIFAAVSALAMFGDDGSGGVVEWPGGLPVPTSEELEVARRRLAQRLDEVPEARNPSGVQQDRLDLMRKIGKRDLSRMFGVEEENAA